MTPDVFLLIVGTVAGAAFIQGAIGIGFALIVAPVISLAAPHFLPVCLLLMMLPLNAHVAWRERGAIDRPGAAWITLGRFAGTFIGVWILAVLSADRLDLLVGASTLAAALAALVAPPFTPNTGSAIGVGVFTGVTETATGIGGPPLALLYQHRPAPVLRATVALCFLVGEAISLVVLAFAGRVGAEHLLAALALLPAVLAGSAASRRVHHRIGGPALRVGVLLFAIVTGVLLLLR